MNKLPNKRVTQIDFSNSHLPKGLDNAFYYLVHKHATLTELNLSHNSNLGDGGLIFSSAVQTLAKGLASSNQVELDLEDTHLNDQDACALAEALKSNTKLKRLILRQNRIGQKGALALLDALMINKTLEILDLSDNIGVSTEFQSSIQRQLMSTSLYRFSATLPSLSEALSEEEKDTLSHWMNGGAGALGWTELQFKQMLVALLTPEIDENKLLECLLSTKASQLQPIEDLDIPSEDIAKLAYIIKNKEVCQFMAEREINPCGLHKAYCLVLILSTTQGRLGFVRAILTQSHTLADFQTEALLKDTLSSPRFWISRNAQLNLSPLDKVAPWGILPKVVSLLEQAQKLEKVAPETISLNGTIMREEELLGFLWSLQKVTSLKVLDLSHCRLKGRLIQSGLSHQLIKQRLMPLMRNLELNELRLSDCDLQDEHLLCLIQSDKDLKSWASLKVFDLSHNPKLTERSLSQLYPIKAAHPHLQIILAHNAQIGPRWQQEMETLRIEVTQEELNWVDCCVQMKLDAESDSSPESAEAATSLFEQEVQAEKIEITGGNVKKTSVTVVELPGYPAYRVALARLEQDLKVLHEQQSLDSACIIKLERKQKILQKLIQHIGEVEIQREQLRQELSKQEWLFYNRFYKRLGDFFMACSMANSGKMLCDKKGTLGKTGFGIHLLGEVVPVVGVGMPLETLGSIMQFSDRRRETEKMVFVTELGDSAELRKAAHGLAVILTERYKNQIVQLCSPEEEKQRDLARKEGAEGVKKQLKQQTKEAKTQVGQVLGSESLHTLCEVEECAEYGVAQLIDCLSNEAFYPLPDAPLTDQLLSFLLKARDSSLLSRIKEGVLERVGIYEITTRPDEKGNTKTWQIGAVYTQPLVQVENQLYRHPKRSVEDSQKDYENYGVLQGSIWEVKQKGLVVFKPMGVQATTSRIENNNILPSLTSIEGSFPPAKEQDTPSTSKSSEKGKQKVLQEEQAHPEVLSTSSLLPSDHAQFSITATPSSTASFGSSSYVGAHAHNTITKEKNTNAQQMKSSTDIINTQTKTVKSITKTDRNASHSSSLKNKNTWLYQPINRNAPVDQQRQITTLQSHEKELERQGIRITGLEQENKKLGNKVDVLENKVNTLERQLLAQQQEIIEIRRQLIADRNSSNKNSNSAAANESSSGSDDRIRNNDNESNAHQTIEPQSTPISARLFSTAHIHQQLSYAHAAANSQSNERNENQMQSDLEFEKAVNTANIRADHEQGQANNAIGPPRLNPI